MDDVARLVFIPPPQPIDFQTGGFEPSLGLLDLNLKAAVGKEKGDWMIEKDLHGNLPATLRKEDRKDNLRSSK